MNAHPEIIERLKLKIESAPQWEPDDEPAFDAPPLRHVTADKLDTDERIFDDELVEGVIGKATLAVLYGDSNSGKTFLAIDIAGAVERSARWMGRNTDGGLVLYLATEAAASVELRAAAYRKRHGAKLAGLVIVQSPINLYDSKADVSKVVALARHYERKTGRRVVLVIGDTLARIAAGANENSGEDMGVVMRNADAIREALDATFLWIHHCGKDAAKGMRGWSGMRAAIDTEIEVTSDDSTGQRCAEVTKQRDLPGKGERIGFRLEPVPMGRNRWGNERSSAIVVGTDAPPRSAKGKRPSEIAGAIVEFLTARGTGCRKGALVKHFEGRYTSSAVYRELRRMVNEGMLNESAGIVAMPGKPGGAN